MTLRVKDTVKHGLVSHSGGLNANANSTIFCQA